ncbi:maleylpyruvate isomerase family mycothiol-dependent enzyme [Micromonosporaceae bacterium Da 78-11]
MTDTPPYADLLSLIDERSSALRDAVTAAPDLKARVPGCPDWSLGDLVSHLGGVQWFWAAAVRVADPSGPPSPEARGDLDPHGDLLEWFAESTRLLVAELADADPQTPVWAWWATSGAPLTAAAVARHQVQEAAVHAYDAQATTGKPEALPAAVAVDGLSEFLTVGLSSLGEWPHRPARIALAPTDSPGHVVDLTPAGVTVDPAASGAPVVTVHATASDLILALYGRIPFADLRADGDREVLAELRDWSVQD